MVRVPVRDEGSGFAATPYVTEPLPLPLAPALAAGHLGELGVAVQSQPADAVTATDPVAPAAATLAEPGEITGAHVAAACMTVKVLPPMVSVPLRDVPLFAATA